VSIAARHTCVVLALLGALCAERGAAQSVVPSLTPGRYSYVLTQVTEQQISVMSGDNTAIVRELYFAMDIQAVGDNQLSVSLALDSVSFAAGTTRRALIAGYTGAGWKGVIARDGRRVRGGLVMQDGRETDSYYVAPLVWVLPLLTGGATDTLSVRVGAERGPPREVTVTRRFAATNGDLVAFSGDLRTKILGETKVGGRTMTVQSSGTMDGTWTIGAGVMQSARLQLRSHEVLTVATTSVERDEQATLTLRRVK
jgi:hypothetical protein